MAKDGDRHQLGDPISRMVDDRGIHTTIEDTTDPALLTDRELRRQLVNLDQMVREARLRGTPPSVQERAKLRLRQLNIEQRRRAATASR
jgi:hypothetical protein